jgi:hypothetical protein
LHGFKRPCCGESYRKRRKEKQKKAREKTEKKKKVAFLWEFGKLDYFRPLFLCFATVAPFLLFEGCCANFIASCMASKLHNID